MIGINKTKLPNSWKKDDKTMFYTVAKVSLILQYISFLLSLLISAYMLYMAFDTRKYSKVMSETYLTGAVILALVSFLLLKLVQMSPTAAVAVLALNIIMFVIREDVIQKLLKMLRL